MSLATGSTDLRDGEQIQIYRVTGQAPETVADRVAQAAEPVSADVLRTMADTAAREALPGGDVLIGAPTEDSRGEMPRFASEPTKVEPGHAELPIITASLVTLGVFLVTLRDRAASE